MSQLLCGSTVVLLVLFSQYLRDVHLPICVLRRKGSKNITEDDSEKGRDEASQQGRTCGCGRMPFFKLFPVMAAIILMWSLCAILTAAGALPENSPARTDAKLGLLNGASWIRIPYPCKSKCTQK